MNYRETSVRLAEYRRQIAELRDKMRDARAAADPEEVPDYVFTISTGSVRLADLFGGKPDLIVIHNMGASCPSCTLWADGFNGVYDHLANRAAFVVSSPDTPALQKSFAASRGWRFPMVSHEGTSFAADMGYRSQDGGWLPGVSVFRGEANRILRVSDTGFCPGDDFCPLWHFFPYVAWQRRRLAAEIPIRVTRSRSCHENGGYLDIKPLSRGARLCSRYLSMAGCSQSATHILRKACRQFVLAAGHLWQVGDHFTSNKFRASANAALGPDASYRCARHSISR